MYCNNLAQSTAASIVRCAGAVERATSLAGAKSAVVGESAEMEHIYLYTHDWKSVQSPLTGFGTRVVFSRIVGSARVTVQEIATGA